MKAYFFQRIFAYAIDIVLVTLVLTLIFMVIPSGDNAVKLEEEQLLISEQYLNQEINSDVYIEKSIPITYDIARENFLFVLVEAVLLIGYFVLFQFYNKGQTLGKKLLRIKVVRNDDDKLQMNDLVIRTLIAYEIFSSLLTLSTLLFLPAREYFYVSMSIFGIQFIVLIVIVVMVGFRKDGRGVHDLLGKTKVVMADTKEVVECVN